VTSRERVLKTLKHQEPDKIPIDLGSTTASGIMAMPYSDLKRYLGIKGGRTRVFDVMQQLAQPEEEILTLFEVDAVGVHNPRLRFGMSNRRWKRYVLPDGSAAEISADFQPAVAEDGGTLIDRGGHPVAKMPEGGFWFDPVYHPLAEGKGTHDIEEYQWPAFTDEELETLHRQAKHLYQNTDCAIVGGWGGAVFEWAWDLRGYENFMLDLVTDRPFAEGLLEKIVEVHLGNLKGYLEAVGDYIQVIKVNDDLGMQAGPQISPELYRKLIKPCQEAVYRYIKEHSRAYIFLHSCGAIYEFIPDLIEVGVGILNPVQTSARGMEPERLKREFGERIAFWGGGCDTQVVLPFATPEEVREHVKERLRIFGPGGGFVFNQIHNIQAGVPPENIVAMLETVREFRNYPIPIP